MIDINLNSHDASFEYFSTGRVVKYTLGESTCNVQRTEGGLLKQVPILGLYGAGGQANNIAYKGDLTNCYVALIKIQGVYCVLGTIPNFSDISPRFDSVNKTPNLKKEDA